MSSGVGLTRPPRPDFRRLTGGLDATVPELLNLGKSPSTGFGFKLGYIGVVSVMLLPVRGVVNGMPGGKPESKAELLSWLSSIA